MKSEKSYQELLTIFQQKLLKAIKHLDYSYQKIQHLTFADSQGKNPCV